MTKRRFLVQGIVQTSEMDCGPASLKCILEGFGVAADYGRLREACQTDVDGTSIDTIEEIAVALGMDAEQLLLPIDHVFLPCVEALPALVVVQLPNLATHFVVVWRVLGPFVQVMDPASGRYWTTRQAFLNTLYKHQMPVPAEAWCEWAVTEDFVVPLVERMRRLGVAELLYSRLVSEAVNSGEWKPLANLDAAVRFCQSLVSAKAIKKGPNIGALLEKLLSSGGIHTESIPADYWGVSPVNSDEAETGELLMSGAVIIRFKGVAAESVEDENEHAISDEADVDDLGVPSVSENLAAVLQGARPNPLKEMFALAKSAGGITPSVIVIAIFIASLTVVFEALLMRGLLDIGRELSGVHAKMSAVGALLIFAVALLLIEIPIIKGLLTLGRNLEVRARIALMKKIPRLSDRFFHSRPTSDMAERGHSLHSLRRFPLVAEGMLRPLFGLLFTTVGIIWLAPQSAVPAIIAAICSVLVPLCAQVLLTEGDMQVRTHEGALSRFYLDAMAGITALKAHSAQTPIKVEQEGILVEWARATLRLQTLVAFLEGLQLLLGFGLAAWILFGYFGRVDEVGAVLLLAYWALNLPVQGQEFAEAARQYPEVRNRFMRFSEPLHAPDETPAVASSALEDEDCEKAATKSQSVNIEFKDVGVCAAGHNILTNVNVSIAAGEHIAIVGPSGAGKSSLVGALLGWHQCATGELLVNDQPLTKRRLQWLRKSSVWIDPSVQLWNQSLLNNLAYGASEDSSLDFAQVIDDLDLKALLHQLPDGMQSLLGENGGLLSGGEGQRVRIGRGMLKSNPQLAILDEPFRGLEREQREKLLIKARALWRDATLLCVSHDIESAKAFNKVIVVDQGCVVEQGDPNVLAENKESEFYALLKSDHDVNNDVWSSKSWRRFSLSSGSLEERGSE